MSGKGLTSTGIIGELYLRLSDPAPDSWAAKIAMKVDSNQEIETYPWIGMAPMMREWVGGREPKGFLDNQITVQNKKYEATLEVLCDWIRRDKTGQVMIRIADMTRRANGHWASLLSTLILAGAATDCYDGQYYFDTNHSEGSSGTNDNDISIDISAIAARVHGSTTMPSPEEMQSCIMQAIVQIMKVKDDQGQPFNEDASEFLVLVPPGLYFPALTAVALPATTLSSHSLDMKNVSIDVQMDARSTWTDSFAVFRTDSETKPLIMQDEVPLQVSAVAEGSELEFKEDKHWYGVWASRNVAYGFWQMACYVTMT